MKTKNHARGLSLLELLIVLSIITLIVGIGIPNFYFFMQKQKLRNAASELAFDLMYAKNYAIKNSKLVIASFTPGKTEWCYAIHNNLNNLECDCQAQASCLLDNNERKVTSRNVSGIEIVSANFAGSSHFTGFEPMRGRPVVDGSIRNGTIWLRAKNGLAAAVVINRLGRIRICDVGQNDCPKPPL